MRQMVGGTLFCPLSSRCAPSHPKNPGVHYFLCYSCNNTGIHNCTHHSALELFEYLIYDPCSAGQDRYFSSCEHLCNKVNKRTNVH